MWNHEASHLKHRKESLLVLKHYKFRGNHHFFHVHLQGAAGSNDALLVDPWPIFWVCGCHISYWCPSEYWILKTGKIIEMLRLCASTNEHMVLEMPMK
jgi:hypothetical protein